VNAFAVGPMRSGDPSERRPEQDGDILHVLAPSAFAVLLEPADIPTLIASNSGRPDAAAFWISEIMRSGVIFRPDGSLSGSSIPAM